MSKYPKTPGFYTSESHDSPDATQIKLTFETPQSNIKNAPKTQRERIVPSRYMSKPTTNKVETSSNTKSLTKVTTKPPVTSQQKLKVTHPSTISKSATVAATPVTQKEEDTTTSKTTIGKTPQQYGHEIMTAQTNLLQWSFALANFDNSLKQTEKEMEHFLKIQFSMIHQLNEQIALCENQDQQEHYHQLMNALTTQENQDLTRYMNCFNSVANSIADTTNYLPTSGVTLLDAEFCSQLSETLPLSLDNLTLEEIASLGNNLEVLNKEIEKEYQELVKCDGLLSSLSSIEMYKSSLHLTNKSGST